MILVTGANGYVGSALLERLLVEGMPVRAAVRTPATPPVLRAKYPQGDVAAVGTVDSATDWSEALAGVEVVVHLAARVHVMRDEVADPLTEFRAVNVEGALNLARQAAKAGVRRFIYLSSIKVNGEGTLPGQFFTEQDIPLPLDPYGISKYEAEEGLRKIAQQANMELVIIRPPLVYGPGVKANFLNMMRWLQKGLPLPFAAIHNYRSLLALDNLVDFIVTCLDHPAAANQIFLVADGEDISTTDLLRRTAAALNVSARLFPVPQNLLEVGFKVAGKSDLARRLCGSLRLDITKARTVLGWYPPVSVNEGLYRMAAHFLRGRS